MSQSPLLRIVRPDAPLGDKVVAAVCEAIAAGDLLPDQRLIERELIESTGVSRTSIREALRQLQAMGLVERSPNGGLRVASLDRGAIQHIYEARSAIETAAAELFILKATEDEFQELAELAKGYEAGMFDQQFDQLETTPWQSYAEIILRGARNPILTEMMAPLNTRIQGLRRLSMSMPGRSDASRLEILEIIDAVLARDTERAIRASRAHVVEARTSALQALGEDQAKAEQA